MGLNRGRPENIIGKYKVRRSKDFLTFFIHSCGAQTFATQTVKIFKFFCVSVKTRRSKSSRPTIFNRREYARTSLPFCSFRARYSLTHTKHMKHLFGLAQILSVEIPESLAESNEENERLDVSVTFRYDSNVQGADVIDAADFEGVDEDLLALAQSECARSDYHYLWDALKTGYEVGDDEKALKELKKKLTGKKLPFTVYVFTISELLTGTKYVDGDGVPYAAVHSEKRSFSSFSNSYLLKYEDKEAVFGSMQTRLLKDLKNKDLSVGRSDDDAEEFAKRIKKQRKAADED